MDGKKEIKSYVESGSEPYIDEVMDDLAPDGVFCVYDEDDPCPYNVRKYADMVKKLGLKRGEEMPERYLKECLI